MCSVSEDLAIQSDLKGQMQNAQAFDSNFNSHALSRDLTIGLYIHYHLMPTVHIFIIRFFFFIIMCAVGWTD